MGDIMVVPCTVNGFKCIFCSLTGDGKWKRKADEIKQACDSCNAQTELPDFQKST